ncbi:DUF397 domain-containing protein [Streptosporangium saharense]|uniref:DUF397 domain-containing protein n=1 Tax=Streptosporangium saharense TaxID=1706840 RepID=UPI00342C858D
MDLSGIQWRKSSLSGNGGADCVEVGVLDAPGDMVARKIEQERFVVLRDSKNPDGPKLFFTNSEWSAFRHRVRDGEFDDLG